MKFSNTFNLIKRRQKNQGLNILICLSFLFLILTSFIYLNNNNYLTEYSNNLSNENNNDDTSEQLVNNLQSSSTTSLLQDPYTKNFDLIRDFFKINYTSSLDFDIATYYRYGDSDGAIIDDTIFSEDNLLYYNSLMKAEIDDLETFSIYLNLKNTTLWYDNNSNNYEYGYVKSIDNTTGEIKNANRYLTDNLLPIFLLIENIGNNDLKSISINGESVIDCIEEIFYLINSSEFWDDVNYGFYNYNSSSMETDAKYTESNLYSILANLLIHRTYYDLELNDTIRDRALELANLTMIQLDDKMWDGNAFYHDANSLWSSIGTQMHYHLSTNALGITTLLEFWIASGMQNDSKYLTNAKKLFNNLDSHLYDTENKLYNNSCEDSWGNIEPNINLDSNAMMMSACLKLFEVTGNITYYDRAVNMSKSIESNLYDKNNYAYNYALTNSTKSLNSNLKLCKAYIDAFNIYNSTVLECSYTESGDIPDYIFNQDVLHLTTVYSFEINRKYYNTSTKQYLPFTIYYDISNYTINYIIKDPNKVLLDQFNNLTNGTTSFSMSYPILDTLPIADGYHLYIWVNTSYFKLSTSLKRFNVISGVINSSIEGLVSNLIQGSVINVSLFINYTRNTNLTLTASLEGDQLIAYPSQQIAFIAFEEKQIDFNLAAKSGATPGDTDIYFRIKSGNIVYLEIKEVIEVGYPFEYSNLLYQSKIVSGDSIRVSMSLKNFLPDVTQTLNVSFIGSEEGYIEDFIQEEVLMENEIKTVSYSLESFDNINSETISIKMRILIHNTEFYSELFEVTLIPKFELISVDFPEKVPQGKPAYFILIIKNNQEDSEDFSLYLNGKTISTNLDELDPGENRIVAKVPPNINPYEFGTRKLKFVLKDSSNNEIERFYFETNLELTALNLILFYTLPIIIPIGLVLFFKNREIKHKKLTR